MLTTNSAAHPEGFAFINAYIFRGGAKSVILDTETSYCIVILLSKRKALFKQNDHVLQNKSDRTRYNSLHTILDFCQPYCHMKSPSPLLQVKIAFIE